MTSTLDQPTETPRRADPSAVVERLLGIFNDGGIAVLASIGHQTGLFETLALAAAGHERAGRRRGGPRRALRAGVARRRRHRGLRGLRARPARTYSLCPEHAPFLTGPDRGQPGPRDALRDLDGPGHPAGRREVPHRGRTVLRRLPRLPRRAGRGERRGERRLPARHDRAADGTRGPAAAPASTSPTSAAARATPSTCWPAPSRPAGSPAWTSPRRRSPSVAPRRRRGA